jgi:vitamin B12 transporter
LVAAAPPEIVVTALASKSDVAYDVVTLDRAALVTSPSGRIEDILGLVAGLQQFRRTDSRAANPTSQGATLRALGGNASSRALVLLDGAPVADPFTGYIPWFALAPERLASVQVTRGAGAGAFGSGALAGTIELRSLDNPGSSAALDGGSRGSLSGAATAAAALGHGSVALSARGDRGDGYVLIPAGQRGPGDIAGRYSQGSFALRVAAPLGDAAALSLDALVFDDHRTRGVAGNTSAVSGMVTSARVTGGTAWRYDALAYLQADTFANNVVTLDPSRTTGTPSSLQYNTPATGIGGKIEVRPPLPFELRIGADVRLDAGQTEEKSRYLLGRFTRLREAGGTNLFTGGFVEASVAATPRLTLTGGARADYWRIGGGFLDERDAQTLAVTIRDRPAPRTHIEPTARGGGAWRLGEGVSVRSAAYLGYRLPTLNELYRPFRVGLDATAANSALAPERLKGVEAGVDIVRPGIRLAATAFYNRVGNAIANTTVATGPGSFAQVGFVAAGGVFRQRVNLAAIVAKGIEVELHATRGPVRLDLSYAYTDSKVRAPGLPVDGKVPAVTPAQAASASLGWVAEWASARLTARYSGPQFDDDLQVRRLGASTTLDAVIEVPVRRGVRLVFRGENLTDTLVASGVSASGIIDRGTPRTLWAGVRIGGR